MCWERYALRPAARQKAPCSSAPVPSVGATSPASGSGVGARLRALRTTSASPPDALDAVVVAGDDLAVVDEERVGDVGEPLERLRVLDADRLVAAIAARHDQRAADLAEQQVVERRGWQHRSLPTMARCHGGRERAAVLDEDDRRSRGRQLGPLEGVQAEPLCRVVQVGDHHREGLVRSTFPLPEGRDRRLVGRVAGEVEPTEPFSATIPPSARSVAACSIGSPACVPPRRSRSARRGPQVGQAIGSAWNLRSAGS